MIVTAGHKDILAVRRSQIPGGLGAWINFIPPDPIVPLESTIQCTGTIGYDGQIVTSIDEDVLRKDLMRLKRQKPQAITISLINAYKNNAHEKQVKELLRQEFGPDIEIVCSSDVLSEIGEYERTVTASANTIVKPAVKGYLDNFQKLLAEDRLVRPSEF